MIPMTRVWERLFVGSRDDAEHLFRENSHGIMTVISLCEEAVLRRAPGINYLHMPIADATPITVSQFDAIMHAIGENVRWGTVLVQCDHGVSRSPILAAAYMHVTGYKNIDAALVDNKRLRPESDPSSILLKSIKEHLG